MVDKIVLGKKIQELRKAAEMTQLQLALEIGINDAYIGQIERGEQLPSLEILLAVVNYFSIGLDASNLSNGDNAIEKQVLINKLEGIDSEEAFKHLFNSLATLIELRGD